MRIKHRYIICQALEDPNNSTTTTREEFTARDLQNVIKEKVESLFGDIGAGSFGTNSLIRSFDINSKIFIVRTSRDAETNLRLAISCITTIKNKNISIRTLGVAGCSRSCTAQLQSIFTTLIVSSNYNEETKVEREKFYANVISNLEL